MSDNKRLPGTLVLTFPNGEKIEVFFTEEDERILAAVEDEWVEAMVHFWNNLEFLPGFLEHALSCDKCVAALLMVRGKMEVVQEHLVLRLEAMQKGGVLPA